MINSSDITLNTKPYNDRETNACKCNKNYLQYQLAAGVQTLSPDVV